MSAHHGNTPAAWTAVSIGLLAFVIGSVGLMVENMTMFWVGIIMLVVSPVIGLVMSRMGLGAN